MTTATVGAPHFNGADYTADRDQPRLGAQLARVRTIMGDGQWRTLRSLAAAAGAPEASVSAQLRNLRKPRFGGYTIERRHEDGGLYSYRLAN